MSSQTFVLPYLRSSPVHVPRRDMVLGHADSLALDVQVVDRDSPEGMPIVLTGGIGGPTLQMLVWPDTCYRHSWDYGAPCIGPRTVLWAAVAVISDLAAGTFTVTFPTATMSSWPRRCAYALQLDEGGGSSTTLLAEGHLHLSRSVPRSAVPVVMLTDPLPAVLTDPTVSAIFIDGVPPP
jgi:hypothetical protein